MTLLGGALGAVLLLVTPAAAFERVVPLLVAVGSLALVCAPWLDRRRVSTRHRRAELAGWLLVIAVYSGYFGAGAGVMTLALMLIIVERHQPTANALKNMLVGASNVPAGLLLAFLAPVHWPQAASLAAGALTGARLGPGLARRMPPTALRWAVFALGIGLAFQLWLDPSL